MKMFFVYNPLSGKERIKKHLDRILEIFKEGGYEVTTHPTTKERDAYETVLTLEGQYDVIACSGGDGTLNEVLSAIATYQTIRPKVGYIPAGTTNDFAGSVGIPKHMEEAAAYIVKGNTIRLDLGAINGRIYDYVVAFGLFADTSYKTGHRMKSIFGHFAYVLDGFRSVRDNHPHQITYYANGEKHSGRYIYGMLSNSMSVGGFKGVAGRGVRLDDGLFELVMVKSPRNPIQVVKLLAGFFWERKTSMVERMRVSRVSLESEDEVRWAVDGEDGGNMEKIDLHVIPNAVRLIVGDYHEAKA